MGKTREWIINLLAGKKEENEVKKQSKIIPATLVSREKRRRRWSFCRRRDSISAAAPERASAVVAAGAAIKIQSVFRAHLARRALKALKGLVKLQALVRGQLVRKQATATLRCMESLMTAQARAGSKRLHMSQEDIIRSLLNQDFDVGPQKHIMVTEKKISNHKPVMKSINIKTEHIKISTHMSPSSSSSSIITTSDHMSHRTFSNHFERYSISPARLMGPFAYPGSEHGEYSSFYKDCNDRLYLYPNYMADTESSRAKLRSQSAPKQRPVETLGRQTSRRTSSYVSKVIVQRH